MAYEGGTPMWMVDANTCRVTMANQAAQTMFGYSADHLASTTIFELVIPEEVEALREAFAARAFAGDGGEWTLRYPGGARYRVRVRYHHVENDGAKLQFTFADEIYGHPEFPEGKTKGVGHR
jgi:PAS domain S-box-containing protein